MILAILIFLIITILAIVISTKQKYESSKNFYQAIAFFAFILTIFFTGMLGDFVIKHKQLPEKRNNIQTQVTEAINNHASDSERAIIRKKIFEINEIITQAKRDNSHWLWCIQTPNEVNTIDLVTMTGSKYNTKKY